jgi:hypothetical protein
VKIILIGLNHEVQWKDPTGDLRKILEHLITNSDVDLVAEEASGLPATVAKRLSCKHDKPWIDIDMSTADRKLSGIYEQLIERKREPIDPCESPSFRSLYLPKEDGIRETEWVRRILKLRVNKVLCLCGFLHAEPFAQKLTARGCIVEQLNVIGLSWFQNLYGKYRVLEEDGNRWCVVEY